MATLKMLEAPAAQPVSVTEAKEYLRVDGNAEDLRIGIMIDSAVARLEAYCDQKFISQKWAQYFDRWPMKKSEEWWDGTREIAISELYSNAREIELFLGPVISIQEFNTYADDGVANLNPSTNYIVDTISPFGRIAIPLGGVWPSTILRKINGIEIKMTVGIASDAASCPQIIKQAILEYVAVLFEHRGDEKAPIPNTSMQLLAHYKRHKLGNPSGY